MSFPLIINLWLFVSLVFVPGYLLACVLIGKEKNRLAEKIGLAMPLGFGISGIGTFAMNLCGILITRNIIMIYLLAASLFLLAICALSKTVLLERPNFQMPSGRIDRLLVLYITIKVFLAFFFALVKPIAESDAWARYARIAKILFYKGTFLYPLTLKLLEDYPPLIILNQGLVPIFQGTWNDLGLKIISPLLLLSLLVLFYLHIKDTTKDQSRAILFSALLVSLPLLAYHSSSAYLDLPLTGYYTISILYLLQFTKNKRKSELMLFSVFSGLSIWIKRGGMYLAAISFLVLAIMLFLENRERIKEQAKILIAAVVPAILIGLPWIIFNKLFAVSHYYSVGQLATSTASTNLAERLAPAILFMLGRNFLADNWHLLWTLFIIGLIFFSKNYLRDKQAKVMLLLLFFNMLLIFYLFLYPSYQFLIDGTLFNRVVMYIIPSSLLFIAYGVSRKPG